MSVLDRAALEDSPLADLHAIASELSIDGYRRFRREQLIDAILDRQQGVESPDATLAEDEQQQEAAESRPRRRGGRRGGRSRGASAEAGDQENEAPSEAARIRAPKSEPEPVDAEGSTGATAEEPTEARADKPTEARAGEPTGARAEEPTDARTGREEEIVEGEVELLPNGSGFLRLAPPEASDDDVYISAAQVKRCELISGDRISGPRRAPRRSERFASLVRIDAINGRPADELADRTRFDDLPAAFPSEQLVLGAAEPTLAAIDALAPIGRGSRAVIVGATRAGKTLTLRRIATALAPQTGLQTLVVLAGVRPEEVDEWRAGPAAPEQAVSLAASADVQDQAVTSVIDHARRLVTRGGDVVVLLDTLDGPHPHSARRALAAARNVSGGGSLTVIATASRPLGGETTVIALDATQTNGPEPVVDVALTGTLRPEFLVGEEGVAAIARAREETIR